VEKYSSVKRRDCERDLISFWKQAKPIRSYAGTCASPVLLDGFKTHRTSGELRFCKSDSKDTGTSESFC